ncbi:MAG: hypothetical protein Q9181_000957 [Wetmoreana brouardii]
MEAFPGSDALCNEHRGSSLLAIGWTLLGLAALTVTMRLYFRSGLRNGINWDDYFIMAALVVGIIGAAFLTKLVQAGGGSHIFCLPPGQIYPVLKWSLLAQVCNVIGIGLVKISVCLCVLRLIDRARRKLSQFLWVLIAFVATSHMVQVMIFLVQCRPLNAVWDPKVNGTCFSSRVIYTAGYANYGLDALTDLICAGIPIFVIHQLQMNIRTKVAVGFLMSLGVLTAGCATAKAITIKGLFGKDYTWAIITPGILTITEHYLGIIIASMPALKPLFNKVLESTVSSPNNSSKRSFQKIESSNAGSHVPQSHATSGRNSLRGDSMRKPPGFRPTSQLELETSRDYELSDATAWPGFARQPANNWARGSRVEKLDEADIHIRGYKHINHAPDSLSVPVSARTVSPGHKVQ